MALICWAAPFLVGISIFLLWLITRWDWLMIAGVITLCAGLAAFALGAIDLVMAYEMRLWRSTLACAALLFANFPVAAAIIAAVIAIETRYTVIVHNASREALGAVRVSGGGCDVSLGTIPPGASVSRTISFHGDGRLEFHADSDTASHEKVIEYYVTSNMGGHTTVRIDSDGSIIIIRR